jgi:hypothetical protein
MLDSSGMFFNAKPPSRWGREGTKSLGTQTRQQLCHFDQWEQSYYQRDVVRGSLPLVEMTGIFCCVDLGTRCTSVVKKLYFTPS